MSRRKMTTPAVAAKRFAVVDTETTGFSRHDRIVEFACVTISEGRIVDEYESLLQPDRDLGPVHVHGITPTMVESAPPFEAIAADIAARLDGRCAGGSQHQFRSADAGPGGRPGERNEVGRRRWCLHLSPDR